MCKNIWSVQYLAEETNSYSSCIPLIAFPRKFKNAWKSTAFGIQRNLNCLTFITRLIRPFTQRANFVCQMRVRIKYT